MRNWDHNRGYRVYYNLHKHCYSVQAWDADKSGWRLYKHLDSLACSGVTFKVYEAGRQKVLKEQKKNVHAFILAKEIFTELPMMMVMDIAERAKRAYYNPYRCEKFKNIHTGGFVEEAKQVLLTSKTIYYVD
jgi:hypothetical protein